MSTQTEIKKLFNKARRIIKHPGLDLLVAPTQEKQGALIIITPGRIGTAVARNTIRRRIKALFHEEGLQKKGFDFVIIVKKDGTKLSYAQLKEIIYDATIKVH
jgi:ribonuclease P protein component